MVLNINRQATVNAGADATICESAGSYTLAGAAVTNATPYNGLPQVQVTSIMLIP
ncbi:MAG: hypothetical protein IPH84_18360 [Bacteroidales bacterium]|nr:hypothetical protein [Bacteroidales bacterium]